MHEMEIISNRERLVCLAVAVLVPMIVASMRATSVVVRQLLGHTTNVTA